MIKLKTHFNHLGLMYAPGDIVSNLPSEIEKNLIDNKAAVIYGPSEKKVNTKAPEQNPPNTTKKDKQTRAKK